MNILHNTGIYSHKLFQGLNKDCNSLLDKTVALEKYNKDEFIFIEGELSKGFYILLEGTAVITVKREKRDVINRIIFKGEVFGMNNNLEQTSIRTKGAKAVGNDIYVALIPIETVNKLMTLDNAFSLKLFSIIINNLKTVEKRLESFVFKDAKDRIIDFIKINANNSGIQVGLETLVKHSFTQQNIADYTGTSRQTVTTILKELRRNNKISFQRKRILVRNLSML